LVVVVQVVAEQGGAVAADDLAPAAADDGGGRHVDMETVVEPLRSLDLEDWDDIDAVEAETRKLLDALTGDRTIICRILTELPRMPELPALAEHYDILNKIMLWDDPGGFRLRLHVFLPGYFDRPQNHRWSYASTI
jgi:hypothetical protein